MIDLNSSQTNFSIKMNFNHFPKEIMELIFTQLTLRNRFQLRSVCRLWSKLIFSNVDHFAIANRQLATKDRHQSMVNHLFCDIEIDRLRLLIFMLNKTNHRLKKLKLSLIDGQDTKEDKPKEFHSLLDEMISVLIQCHNLTSVHFDYGFKLPEDKFELIYRHLGGQLVELFCTNDSSMDNFPLALKYLESSKVQKLALDNRHEDRISVDQIIQKFPLLTYFGYAQTHNFEKMWNPFNVQLFNSMTNLIEIDISFISAKTEPYENIFSSSIASKLTSFTNSLSDNGSFDEYSGLTNYHKLSSLRHLKLQSLSESEAAVIANHLPQLQSLQFDECCELLKDILNHISRLKSLKMLDFYYWWSEYDQLETIRPMPNVKFLGIQFSESRIDYLVKFLISIATVFPNVRCLDIDCTLLNSNHFINFLSRLSSLRELRLQLCVTNPLNDKYETTLNEFSKLTKEKTMFNFHQNSFHVKQQLKSFCQQNQIEFLCSQYEPYMHGYHSKRTEFHFGYSSSENLRDYCFYPNNTFSSCERFDWLG